MFIDTQTGEKMFYQHIKARLVRFEGKYFLLRDGATQELSLEQTREFVKNFNTDLSFLENSPCDIDVSTGETVAVVDVFGNLTLSNPIVLNDIFADFVNYLTLAEYAEKHGKQRNILGRHCRDGRILGAVRRGKEWYIPEDAPYIANARASRSALSKQQDKNS